MFSKNVMEVIQELLDNGAEVSLHKDSKGGYYVDLHTHAKSHLYMREENGVVIFDMRYDQQETIEVSEGKEAILYLAAACYAYNCICGRNFGSPAWDKICYDLKISVIYGSM